MLLPTEVGQRTDSIPGFDRVMTGVRASSGVLADLYERRDPQPYARFVAHALQVPDEQAIDSVTSPTSQFDPARRVLVAPDDSIEPELLSEAGDAGDTVAVLVGVEAWEPGHMRFRLEPAAPRDGYLVVSENWYTDWRATVDGVEASVVRGNASLIAVVIPAGAQIVELRFLSSDYALGKWISFLSLALVAVGLVLPPVRRRRKPHG